MSTKVFSCFIMVVTKLISGAGKLFCCCLHNLKPDFFKTFINFWTKQCPAILPLVQKKHFVKISVLDLIILMLAKLRLMISWCHYCAKSFFLLKLGHILGRKWYSFDQPFFRENIEYFFSSLFQVFYDPTLEEDYWW